jgi:carbonic anhydrase
MIPLDRELHNFAPEHFGMLSDLLEGAPSGECDTLMIACSDHGTAPDHVSFARPGRFFILQHLVSSVPAADDFEEAMPAADIEYAMYSNEIRNVIVCGHLQCGIIRNFLQPGTAECGSLKERFLDMALEVLDRDDPASSKEDLMGLLIREHVLAQVENLQTHSFIQDRLEAGTLKFHAWVVNDATARVSAYHAGLSEFVPIEETM